jgi:hypothetical protein
VEARSVEACWCSCCSSCRPARGGAGRYCNNSRIVCMQGLQHGSPTPQTQDGAACKAAACTAGPQSAPGTVPLSCARQPFGKPCIPGHLCTLHFQPRSPALPPTHTHTHAHMNTHAYSHKHTHHVYAHIRTSTHARTRPPPGAWPSGRPARRPPPPCLPSAPSGSRASAPAPAPVTPARPTPSRSAAGARRNGVGDVFYGGAGLRLALAGVEAAGMFR